MTTDAGNPLSSLSDSLADAVERTGNQLVTVSARRRAPATGVQVRPGIIVTADHVIEREENISVTLPDGGKIPATLVGRDPTTDIAVLSVDGVDLGQPKVAARGPRTGQLVAAVARPGDHGLAVSFGALSSVGGEFRTHGGGRIDQLIRPDLTFYPGFSGSVLIDVDGGILGLNTSGLARGLPLTIPLATLKRVVDQLQATGSVKRGYLGLRLQGVELPASIAQTLSLDPPHGLLVVAVEPDGPGEMAGLYVGDVVVTLAGKPISQSDSVQASLDPETVGKPIVVGIVRGGERKDLTLTIGERPAGTHDGHGHRQSRGHGDAHGGRGHGHG